VDEKHTIFADRLREAMDNRGVRAIDIAKNTNISRASICQYLQGKFIPRSESIVSIARYLGVDVEWLSGYAKPNQNKMYSADERIAQLEEEVAELRLDIQLLKKIIQKQ
jgi:transcriptional regulator with XRE-family HTH domain